MRTYKNYVLTAAGALAVIGAFALFSPSRSEAQFASPVRVANTAAAPALTSSIDDPGRIPYQSTVFQTCTGANCTFTFGALPTGHRLVIQHVSGILGFSGSGTQISVILRAGGPDAVSFLASYFGPRTEAEFDQSVSSTSTKLRLLWCMSSLQL
jgi:hypothetical protein